MTSERPKGAALRYLGLGAGIQSSIIVELMVLGILPKVDLAVFSDLEDEPAYVYRQLECLEGRLEQIGVPLVRLHAYSAATPGSIVGKLLSDTVYMSIPAYAHLDGKRAQLRQATQSHMHGVSQGAGDSGLHQGTARRARPDAAAAHEDDDRPGGEVLLDVMVS